MNKKEQQCPELAEKTAIALNDEVLVGLFITTQRNNLDLSIEQAIRLSFIYLFFWGGEVTYNNNFRNCWELGMYYK